MGIPSALERLRHKIKVRVAHVFAILAQVKPSGSQVLTALICTRTRGAPNGANSIESHMDNVFGRWVVRRDPPRDDVQIAAVVLQFGCTLSGDHIPTPPPQVRPPPGPGAVWVENLLGCCGQFANHVSIWISTI